MKKTSEKVTKKEKVEKNIDEDVLEDRNDDQILLLGNRIKELEEKLMREKAELINFKKRTETEVFRMLKYCNEEVILDLIKVLDNFERALKNDGLNAELSKYLDGFEMIAKEIRGILEKFEVKEIESLNKEFDANYQQAVMTEKVEGVETGIVLEVLLKGYMYKDKVIRHAMVKVSE